VDLILDLLCIGQCLSYHFLLWNTPWNYRGTWRDSVEFFIRFCPRIVTTEISYGMPWSLYSGKNVKTMWNYYTELARNATFSMVILWTFHLFLPKWNCHGKRFFMETPGDSMWNVPWNFHGIFFHGISTWAEHMKTPHGDPSCSMEIPSMEHMQFYGVFVEFLCFCPVEDFRGNSMKYKFGTPIPPDHWSFWKVLCWWEPVQPK